MSGGPCYRCGKNPAEGYASIWTAAEGERFYCHGDDEDVSCYERTNSLIGEPLERVVTFLLRPDTDTRVPSTSEGEGT